MTRPAVSLLALVALSVAGVLAAPAAPANAVPCAVRAGEVSVATLVDFGTVPGSPGGVSELCVPASARSTGLDVLAARADTLHLPRPTFNNVGLLCSIDGYPASGCDPTGKRYWSYWFGGSSGWSYAHAGPGSRRVDANVTEGWRYVESADEASAPVPRGPSVPGAICKAAVPPPANGSGGSPGPPSFSGSPGPPSSPGPPGPPSSPSSPGPPSFSGSPSSPGPPSTPGPPGPPSSPGPPGPPSTPGSPGSPGLTTPSTAPANGFASGPSTPGVTAASPGRSVGPDTASPSQPDAGPGEVITMPSLPTASTTATTLPGDTTLVAPPAEATALSEAAKRQAAAPGRRVKAAAQRHASKGGGNGALVGPLLGAAVVLALVAGGIWQARRRRPA